MKIFQPLFRVLFLKTNVKKEEMSKYIYSHENLNYICDLSGGDLI